MIYSKVKLIQCCFLNIIIMVISSSCVPEGKQLKYKSAEELKKTRNSKEQKQSIEEKFDSLMQVKCLSCHSPGGSASFANYLLPTKNLIDLGHIIPGEPESSKIYYRLKGANLGIAPENMPLSTSLSSSDIKIVYDFIVSLAIEDTTPPPSPIISHPDQSFSSSFVITALAAEENANIRYSLSQDLNSCNDGELLTAGQITIPEQTVKIRFISCDLSKNASQQITRTYTYNPLVPNPPFISEGSKTFKESFPVTLSAQAGMTIRYSLDDSDLTDCSLGSLYSSSLTISGQTVILKAISCGPNGQVSFQSQAVYTYDNTPPATPTLNPPAQEFASSLLISLATNESDAILKYTLDGADLTSCTSGTIYSAPFTIDDSVQIKVIACDIFNNASPQATAVYTKSLKIDHFEVAKQVLQSQCINCHFGTHQAWATYSTEDDWLNATNSIGEKYIDKDEPLNSLLLRRIIGHGESQSNMPLDNTNAPEEFSNNHYLQIKDWVLSLVENDDPPVNSEDISLSSLEFTELGLKVGLSCTQEESIKIEVQDEQSITNTGIDDYQHIISDTQGLRENSTSAVSVDAQGLITLNGSGEDIWLDRIWFTGISKPIVSNQLDISMTIQSVTGLEHDYAKIGLLVSSSDDLSGQLAFVHWSGRQGLGIDSGSGLLDGYRSIITNSNSGSQTPAPTTLKLKYENGKIRSGACYDCQSPEMSDAPLNFIPKKIFIIASPHATSPIQVKFNLLDNYSNNSISDILISELRTCPQGDSQITYAPSYFGGTDKIKVSISKSQELKAQQVIEKDFSSFASCTERSDLLPRSLRRLTQQQIQNSLVSVFGDIFDSSSWVDLGDSSQTIGMNALNDKLQINTINYERLYNLSGLVFSKLSNSHTQTMQCIQSSSNTCVASYLNQMAPLMWRKSLLSIQADIATIQSNLSSFASNQEKLEYIIFSLLLSDQFLFRSEIGSVQENIAILDDYEIINALSFSLWNSSPDQELYQLANATGNITDAQLRAQVQRMIADPKAKDSLLVFFKDFLKLDKVLSIIKSDLYELTEEKRSDLLLSAEMMLRENMTPATPLMSILSGNTYYMSNRTKELFGYEPLIPSTELFPITLNGQERTGILNHPAFLISHSQFQNSGIVKRGVFTLEQLLCYEIPAAPADVTGIPLPDNIDPNTTSTRDLLEITHSGQPACVGCHQYIDPAGFGYENFDGFGRYRTTEKNNIPIDASGKLTDIGNYTLEFNTSAEYSQVLQTSPQMASCLPQRYLEHQFGLNLKEDSCEVEKFNGALQGENTIQEVFNNLINLESFRKRKIN